MIAYDLQCINGHVFEGWFKDIKAYEDQEKKGLIACPVCNSDSVSRILSTFSIKKTSQPLTGTLDHQSEFADLTRKITDFVEKNFDDVGCDFTKEALKIHYGASEPRNIRGSSTKEEEKTLNDEGIEFFKLPLQKKPDTDT